MESNTVELLDRAQQGDAAARDQLLMRYRPRLTRMVMAMMDARLSARLDPSDILQDAMTIASQRLPDYLAERPVAYYAWLRQIVKELLIDVHRKHIRAQKRSIHREQALDFQLSDLSAMQLADQLFSREPSPSGLANQRETAAQLKQAMGSMPPLDLEVLLMRFVEQLSISEMSEALSITENAVKARVRRAIERLGRVVFSGGVDES